MGISKSVTARLDASRERTRDRAREVTLLLSLLTKTRQWRTRAHIAPAAQTRDNEQWHYVVCLHDRDEAMAWRFSDEEIATYFAHLGASTACEHQSVSRTDKMDRLEELACAAVKD